MDNPIDGIIPDFTIFGAEFTNIWQKLSAGLWGLAIIAAIVFLIMGLFKLGSSGETNPQGVAEAKKQIIRSAVALGGLVALGVVPETRVALAMRRSVELVIGMYAVLRAGGAYVPVDPDHPLDRVAYILDAADPLVVLTTHRDDFTATGDRLVLHLDDLDDTVRRLKAYEAAGANVLYAPAISSLDVLRQVTGELRKPFNALVVFFPRATVDDLAAAGAKRLSVGSGLAWASLAPILKGAGEMLERGTFTWTADMAAGAEAKRYLAT